ncbi:type II toxin-antitoxin system ParD family antitoxin [Vibrio ezurae]|uniref:Uncharacterized protein n=1 Tax=Vibrio ezurae NBRC 102218 TaxID=1219080 RepID=U3B327_9VIBR|nr:type II toxin-antitoxin system ParD family antitoxin [Vibrio ezurae]GAD79862.1 hypothetical protein VEZ01S_20_01350 [Vibrio ezurae NBRC 102218]
MVKNTNATSKDEETKLHTLRNRLVQGEQSEIVDYSYESLIEELDNVKINIGDV